MDCPEISVLMSCYNASHFLDESVASVLHQTFTEFEFIAIDDGSRDDTAAILHRYAKRDSRMVVIQKDNTGLADSLNVGIHVARGQWIARLDADDIALPTRLAAQIAFVHSRLQTVLVGSGFIEIDQIGRPVKTHRYPRRHQMLMNNLKGLSRFFPHSSAMFRSDLVRQIGGYNIRFQKSQDRDLWLRLAEHGRIACLRTPLVKVRKHCNSVSHIGGKKVQLCYGLAATVCHLLREHGTPDPSCTGSQIDWYAFYDWVTVQAESTGYVQRREEWSRVRQSFYLAPNKVASVLHLLGSLLRSSAIRTIVREKLSRATLAGALAEAWMRTSAHVTPPSDRKHEVDAVSASAARSRPRPCSAFKGNAQQRSACDTESGQR